MQYYITTFVAENCTRCGNEFICKPNDISQCDCMKVRISPEEQNFISAKALTCVCNSCLKDLKLEYYHHYHKNTIKENAQ